MSASGRALDGIKVLEVGSWIAGPAAATIMSDFGAEVIKVEPPGAGDPYRQMPRLPGMPLSEHNYSWLLDSRNKKSLALDVTKPEGGEEATKPGFDVNAWWARSGLMDLVRPAGAQPTSSMPGMGDHPTAVALFGAIALGLYQRERTGRGAKVSTSLMANGAWANSVLIQALLCGATFVERPPREQALNALVILYQCRDGRWFVLTLLTEEKDWERFARGIGRADLIPHARFATMAARHANSPAPVKILDGVFAEKDWAQWQATLEASDIAFEAGVRLQEFRHDRQMAATGTLAPLEGAGIPGLRTVMSPIEVADQTRVPPTRAPDLGEHTDEVLRAAGYDPPAIRPLHHLRVL